MDIPMFEIGDRVRALCSVGFSSETYDCNHIGETGTIVEVGSTDVGVFFDNDITGHDLNRKCKKGHGWWINPDYLEPYIEELPAFEPASVTDLMSMLGG